MAKGRLTRGFSLVELMVAAGIMGIIVSVALPRYRFFVAHSRMAEAKANLGVIHGLQLTYKAEFEQYYRFPSGGGMGYTGNCSTSSPGNEAKNELGFRVANCSALRYYYTTSGAGDSFTANANSNGSEIYPDCKGTDYNDIWTINVNINLTHDTNVISKCKE